MNIGIYLKFIFCYVDNFFLLAYINIQSNPYVQIFDLNRYVY